MSRFVSCPLCGKSIALMLINDHMDSPLCSVAELSSAAPAPAKRPLAPRELAPSPAKRASLRELAPAPAKRPPSPQVLIDALESKTLKAERESLPQRSVLDALRPQAASAFDEPIRYRPSSSESWRTVGTDCELSALAPLSLHRSVLSADVANELLWWLRKDAEEWERGSWIVHGKQHAVPRTSAWFALDESNRDEGDSGSSSNVSVYGRHGMRLASAVLKAAAAAVADLVRSLRPAAHWSPSGALANRYRDGSETVGAHSDFINHLGPRPIIVGLSLGASRRFDLVQQPPVAGDARGASATVRIVLPHNSAIVMWDDAQESWHHSVPRCADASVGAHPLVGLTRFSLTFRMKRADMPPLPRCFCGVPAALKARGTHEYWLFCDPSRSAVGERDLRETAGGQAYQDVAVATGAASGQHAAGVAQPVGGTRSKQCGFRQRFEWAEREAARLRGLGF